MENLKISFDKVKGLSLRDVSLQLEDEKLRDFYKYSVDMSSFEKVMLDKSRQGVDRTLLVNILNKQSNNFPLSNLTQSNISKLSSTTTFTITTAHQPSFLTGPLYFIYKIFSTINLTEKLKLRYPNNDFVPVYVIGGEDHDFEEVNHVHLFGQSHIWDSEESGAVGRMSIQKMQSTLEEVYQLLGTSHHAMSLRMMLEASYKHSNTYAEFTLYLVRSLFDKYGLVCLSMDDRDLKREMKDVFMEELLVQSAQPLVEGRQSLLNKLGFKSQVHARDINLFYLRDGIRSRIVLEKDTYTVLKSDYVFTKEELIEEFNNYPERFSPNVILRPLFQEKILPNLAYVGGGGELAYWMEIEDVFEKHNINFPMLLRRDSVLLLDATSQKLLTKTGMDIPDLFGELDTFVDQLITSDYAIDMVEEMEMVGAIFDRLLSRSREIDPALKGLIEATRIKQIKAIDNISSKFKKSLKQKQAVKLNQLNKLWSRVHPNGKLQERYDNFIPFYLQYGEEFFDVLKQELDPMDKRFKVVKL